MIEIVEELLELDVTNLPYSIDVHISTKPQSQENWERQCTLYYQLSSKGKGVSFTQKGNVSWGTLEKASAKIDTYLADNKETIAQHEEAIRYRNSMMDR